MNRLFLQGILLLQGSFFSLLFSSSPSLISLYLLAALCFACLMELRTANKGALVLSCLSLCTIPFFPVLSCYLPLWSFHLERPYRWLCLFPSIGCLYGIIEKKQPLFLMIALWMLISCWLQEAASRHQVMAKQAHQQRDLLIENNRLLEEQNRSLLREKEYEIQIATLDERNRIARDIHDSIGHILSSALLQAGAINALLTQQELKEPLRKLQDTLQQGMENARRSVHDLYDTSVDFQMELHRLLDQHADLPITLQYQLRDPLPPHTIAQLLAVITEGIHNMEVHADVHHALLKVLQQPGFYQLILRNDGVRLPIREGGMGLANIRKRIYELGGHVHIHCTKDCFQLFITLPIRTKEETSCD